MCMYTNRDYYYYLLIQLHNGLTSGHFISEHSIPHNLPLLEKVPGTSVGSGKGKKRRCCDCRRWSTR